MKHTQLLHAWSLRSITSGDGRRHITLWRGSEPEHVKAPVVKAFVPAKAKTAAKLLVKFAAEGTSAFAPAVHAAPIARSNVSKTQNPKTH